ncbi:ATP-binding protein [Kitasatospora herbaricolor]|uniref:ATP-binding protein n=1 Tax=Kitasatospora herbaricolor TaxID=68217 RepID=A0ABZ1W0N2_9ACTN|nr:ATP-binding protein [Kitasatospora herbaricolor]
MTTHPIARPPAAARAAAAPAGAGHTATTGVEAQERPLVADTATALLPYEPQSAAAARRLVRTALQGWEMGDLVEAGELVVSELAGNAAKTGCRRSMAVTVERVTDRSVRISVRDSSRTLPCLIDAGPAAESGRGLALVHHLTGGQWGATAEPFGKTVHADLRAPPLGPAPA